MNRKPWTEFVERIRDRLPGFVVCFDLADTKRRNLYLGFARVDHEIELFENLAGRHFPEPAYHRRVAGDRWLCFTPTDPEAVVRRLANEFSEARPIEISQICRATRPDGELRETRRPFRKTIVRGFRSLVNRVGEAEEAEAKILRLLEQVSLEEVTGPATLPGGAFPSGEPASRWRCLDDHDVWRTVCPFCQQEDFQWIEGTDDAMFGACRGCGAECDFTIGPASSG